MTPMICVRTVMCYFKSTMTCFYPKRLENGLSVLQPSICYGRFRGITLQIQG